MKKIFTLILAFSIVLSFAACGRDINYIIGHEPSFRGVVTSIEEDRILIRVNHGEAIKAPHPYVSVSLAVKNADGKYFGEVGDEVEVYYDGTVSDGEIGKVDHVYCILIMTPADRSMEDVS